ncbi:putative serine/threonine-protein kinase-like protein CCR3 [Hibiscus syriacus]|uniref:non-specific serine/threonine protein kinase n=1 Tax=Hibiscus syriacus TaxID=106335 RepID=A0A6A2ZUD2_HIBSY|nr:putative serine/threonine-protein kinase-like protein CCR3 [Hibiscus syriacus]KAE8695601.1 putative serine/threonine-protein kinase-like protein CCR3 [Hibiscus syriacus]
MTKLSFLLLFAIFLFPVLTLALGSSSTLAVVYGTATVCAIVASEPNQRIICLRAGGASSSAVIPIQPNVSYSALAGGRTNFCALRSGGYSLLCWDTNTSLQSFPTKRVYNNNTALLQSLSIGDEQICATARNSTPPVSCWRTDRDNRNNSGGLPHVNLAMDKITSGFGFSCGIVPSQNSRVTCWGNSVAEEIERQFGNMSMANIEAGVSHVCGVNAAGELVCRGNNSTGQLDVPLNRGLGFASGLALGDGFSCGIRRTIRTVVCWGSMNESAVEGIEFESIVAGLNFTCGITTRNFSVLCWGLGWPGPSSNSSINELPLRAEILPGPCIDSPCTECGLYPQSSRLCSGSGNICRPSPCFNLTNPSPPPLSPPSIPDVPRQRTPSRELRRGLLAFAIVGSVGGFMGICTIVYCLWTGVCFGKKKVHNSVQPTITRAGSNGSPGSNNGPPSRSLTIRRQGSRSMKRQRSGTSSKHADRAEEFSLAELAAATNNFSLENKIGAGSFGVVYRGKLVEGRDVAIKRGETGQKTKKYQEKETAFNSELAFLSRLHHKHLVRLVGYCEERDERLLVYEYMKNGALYDHLHNKNNIEKASSLLNSWKMRIKIALDAARGIEYLHNYAVPSIIHRDIKSSNILLDANWTARVSDFGLSMMGPESDQDYRPMKAAGTVGYIDPEYYGLNVLTTKSDVYGLGVVMLELLTRKRAIFKNEENGGNPMSLVDFAVPAIMAGELAKVLDIRVGPPEMNEAEAVELMAYTAMHCVNLEGKERPTISDIVCNLERAVTVCHGSHGSISSGGFEIVSE